MSYLDITTAVLQQGGGEAGGGLTMIIGLLFVVSYIAGAWKTFSKANQPGWAAIIPIYNWYIMFKIGNNEWWWVLVMFVPIVNIYATYKLFAGVSNAFGYGIGFTLGLWFLGFLFFPLLGFGDATYRGSPTLGA
ncbi:DUF5684 domain-containing protein [Natrinema versiforme]|uniref:Signal peptidase I n=1 Tax=Natrinema versiforme TaxID=88724 RepID=A0A4P8WID0_9EURY|nr:DUF5684 domain-containing protein [Natrinema versiforme]QCS43199.1 signal peptidase I [Natrinema versiforme]